MREIAQVFPWEGILGTTDNNMLLSQSGYTFRKKYNPLGKICKYNYFKVKILIFEDVLLGSIDFYHNSLFKK